MNNLLEALSALASLCLASLVHAAIGGAKRCHGPRIARSLTPPAHRRKSVWPIVYGKEMHFFSELALKLGENVTYESFWPHDYISGSDRSAPLVDATPAYLQSPRAPMRLRAMVPQARIVVLVRVRPSCMQLIRSRRTARQHPLGTAALPLPPRCDQWRPLRLLSRSVHPCFALSAYALCAPALLRTAWGRLHTNRSRARGSGQPGWTKEV